MNRKFQPHESHIQYLLQFLVLFLSLTIPAGNCSISLPYVVSGVIYLLLCVWSFCAEYLTP